MILRCRKRIGLAKRTALLMITPMVLAISVFGYFVTVDKIESTEINIKQRSKLLVRHFSSIIELGVVAKDKTVLSSYADFMLKEPGVISVLIRDLNNNDLIEKEIEGWRENEENVKYFSSPVYLSGVAVGGIENEVEQTDHYSNDQPIGIVRVGVMTDDVHVAQKNILIIGLLSTLAGILISILMGNRISRVITAPILNLNKVVDALTAGHLSTRVKEGSKGEVGALEHGVNKMAESLSNAQAELLEKVNRATNDLSVTVSELEQRNIELDKSRQEAEALGEEKAQFLARMSHELRTPLNAVIGFSQLLEKNISEHDRREYIKTIATSATQLSTVIDDVLTFSKLKSGSLHLNKAMFSPRTVCEDTVAMLSTVAYEKDIELVLLIDNNVPNLIDGDAVRINQILTNLLYNAIKFTDSGDVIVSVECIVDEYGDRLMISVKDTGCGISSDNIDNLFKEFAQVENVLTRQSDGVGLGLSISRYLARVMGGDISVTSIESKGSCFSFVIPFSTSSGEDQSGMLNKPLSGKYIMLFEMHPESRQSLDNMLGQLCVNVFVAKDIGDAKKYLVDHKNDQLPDMIVLGLSSEQLTSTESIDIIDEFTALYEGPILLLVGANNCELPVSIINYDRLLCVSKPIRQESLCKNISVLLHVDNLETKPDKCVIETSVDGSKVLVVEDNKFNQTLIRMMLEERSAEVKVVDNRKDAIAASNDKKYNVILMDLHMPGCDGISVAREIRSSNCLSSDVPIILVTADVLFDAKSYIDEGVVNQVLHKPINESVLNEMLAKHCCDCVDEKREGAFNTIDDLLQKLSEPLQNEITRLCDAASDALKKDQMESARDCVHQLVGLTGFYQLHKTNEAVISLQQTMKDNGLEESLRLIRKIKKTIAAQ